MKLKAVTATVHFVVAVPDDADSAASIHVAEKHLSEALGDVSPTDFNVDVEPYRPGEINRWDEDSIPYGGDGKTTTGGYAPAEPTPVELEAAGQQRLLP